MEIRVTIGPWRDWDITGELRKDHKIILIDIYSVRVPDPKGEYVTDLITNVHKLLAGKELTAHEKFHV